MREIVFFTTNPGKLQMATEALSPLGITVVPRPFAFVEIQTDDQVAILEHKFSQVKESEDRPFLVDDAAIYFRAYRSFPGVMSRYVFDMLGYDGLLRLLPAGVTREAYFRGLLGFGFQGRLQIFEGICNGEILPAVRQSEHAVNGFPFDRIFRPAGEVLAMAELPPERRLLYSYRGQALARFREYLANMG